MIIPPKKKGNTSSKYKTAILRTDEDVTQSSIFRFIIAKSTAKIDNENKIDDQAIILELFFLEKKLGKRYKAMPLIPKPNNAIEIAINAK